MPTPLPALMLMLGMDTMDTILMPMATTDHMDTDTGMERDLPMLNPPLMLMLALMLMLGTDTTATIHMLITVTTDLTDIGVIGERSKHALTNNETVFFYKRN